jgi:hypothetical protein
MPRSVSSSSASFSWLRASYRPPEEEVRAYAHLIANAEGYPSPTSGSRLFDEAELQLWIWRAETQQRRSAPRPIRETTDTKSARSRAR